jgi:uncharacterized protein (TIGR00299 family) protein
MSHRTLFLESFAGIAGDMFTAAFLDAGLVDPEAIRAVPRLLKADGVEVEIVDSQRASARFKQVRVITPGGDQDKDGHHGDHHHVGEGHHDHGEGLGHRHHHYHYPALVRQLEESDLDPSAIEFALRVFRLLAEAEADSHGVPVEKVAFHEVGAVDSVVDVAMAGVCVAAVSPQRVFSSPVKLGRGTIQIQHGTYPVPPPASARLAIGMPVAPVPDAIERDNVELSTPTGLAILKALDPEFTTAWPSGTLVAQGSGAGTMDLGDYPNVFRVALFEESPKEDVSEGETPETPASPLPYHTDQVMELRCNVDDQTGEKTAWVMEKGMALGALDGWVTPIFGKKGRPASELAFLVRPEDLHRLSDFLLRKTSSFGVRYSRWDRFTLSRKEVIRETGGGPVSYKVGRTTSGEELKEKPEFEDLRKIWDREMES